MGILRASAWLFLGATVLSTSAGTHAQTRGNCPLTIGVAPDGAFLTSRFNGWYKTSPKLLEDMLRAGCHPDEDQPKPISFVALAVARSAPGERIKLMYSILERRGWPKDRVHAEVWTNYPKKPVE